MTTTPMLGIALPTRFGNGPADTLAYQDACVDVARDHDAAVVLIAGHHGQNAGLQNVPLAARILSRVGTVPVAPLFLAATWPPQLLVEQVTTLRTMAGLHGSRVIAVIASGAHGEPPVMTPENPEGHRGRGTDLALSALIRAGVETWVAGERGRGLRRANDGDGWVANAVYGDDELREQLAVVAASPVRAVRRDVVWRRDPEEADVVVRQHLDAGYRTGMRSDHVIKGDTAACMGQLQHLGNLGFTHVLLRPMAPTVDEAVSTLATLFSAVAAAPRKS